MTDRLMTIPRHDGDELRIDLETYKGHTFLSLRTYFKAPDGNMRPTKKGVSVPFSALGDLQIVLGRALGKTSGPRPGTVSSVAALEARADLINNQVIQCGARDPVGDVIDPTDGNAA